MPIRNTFSNETLWRSAIHDRRPHEVAQSLAGRHRHNQAVSYVVSSLAFNPLSNIVKATGASYELGEDEHHTAWFKARRQLESAFGSYQPQSGKTAIRQTAEAVREIRRLRSGGNIDGVESPRLDCAASVGHILIEREMVTLSYSGDVSVWVDGWLLFQPQIGAKPLNGHVDRKDTTGIIASVARDEMSTVIIHSAAAEPTQPAVTSIDHLKHVCPQTDFAALELHF